MPCSRPYVLLSAAMSADGYIDDASPRRLVLSGPEDLDRVDEVRAGCDAIMVGAGTIRADNPKLLIRSPARRAERLRRSQPENPVKVTITGSGDLDPDARFFAADGTVKLVYAAAATARALGARLGDRATVISPVRGTGLAVVLADLAGRGIGRLMIEGGASLLGQALSEGLADELQLAVAPVFVSDPAAPRLLATGGAVPGPMRLAGIERAGDVAVLRYLAGGQASAGRDR
jgi:5-amino-6-(5-phosphoribosylamino)uracil reductase